MDIEKKTQELQERLTYIKDIFGSKENESIRLLESKLMEFMDKKHDLESKDTLRHFRSLEDLFAFLEKKLETQLTAMDRVRIVRHPQRICLKDILENVYDNYTEIGGQDECSIDPSMLIARAYITRRRGKKLHYQPVMVIGQEKGHGQEFRNGGSVKPWGNAKALHYMKVAETEGIPIHSYIFTPGSYPIEDYPGAAQQIAKNLYEMAGIRVPIVSVTSEGGSGGAEAIGLADTRLMLSHGYYSVISPEGAAAIEGRLRHGKRATHGLIEKCARQLKITAPDNLSLGTIDGIIQEPPLGAKPDDFIFFKKLRQQIIRATDELVLNVRGMRFLRSLAIRKLESEQVYVRWGLASKAKDRLVWLRYKKYRKMTQTAFNDKRPAWRKGYDCIHDLGWGVYSFFRYDLFAKHQRKVTRLAEDVQAELQVIVDRSEKYWRDRLKDKLPFFKPKDQEIKEELTTLSSWENRPEDAGSGWTYLSPQAKTDRTVTCPNSGHHGCQDQWAPDLFDENAGVCAFCGHHFPMEHEWYLYNLFDPGSVFKFNHQLEAGNPLNYEGLDLKLDEAKKKTGQKSGCMTFETRIKGITLNVAMFMARFRGGSVGAAEGEKFIRAIELARKRHLPFLSYVHGTAGIRIQEGTNGVAQMPRCTMAVRRYLQSGGLYIVLYDNNSYAGPVASFLGCSPYQFAVRSSNIGFAGPGVIKETTGLDIPPDYHRAYHALSRGHIQGIWDRREIRNNLHQALLTMGGRNLYYR
ncbi:acetyl-CoA carboxylase carboxyl transferase subunit alpha/beta [Desulfoplanes sp.]